MAGQAGYVLRLACPKDTKPVSLRAKVGDRPGETAEQTITDACLLR